MKRILLLFTIIATVWSCEKDDKTPTPSPYPKEEQNRLIKDLSGYWEIISAKSVPSNQKPSWDYDYAITKDFSRYDMATVSGDTFVLPRDSRLIQYELSPGLEINGHKTIWLDDRNSSKRIPTEYYYITNDTLHIYRATGVYQEGQKVNIELYFQYKRKPNVKFVKEEEINKELIGKWVSKSSGTFEFFDNFSMITTNQEGATSKFSYQIRYAEPFYKIYSSESGGIYYDRKEKILFGKLGDPEYTKIE